jgi:hypothetical protein
MKLTLLKPLVRLDLLEAVRPELLARFLRPFEGYLAARGIVLGGSSDLAWVSNRAEIT